MTQYGSVSWAINSTTVHGIRLGQNLLRVFYCASDAPFDSNQELCPRTNIFPTSLTITINMSVHVFDHAVSNI